MASLNPYESPQSSEIVVPVVEQAVYPTRMRATLAGMWRGAKLGFLVMCFFFLIMAIAAVFLAFFVPGVRREMLQGTTVAEIAVTLAGNLLMSAVMIPVFSVLYGSLPGAAIMGLAAAIRWRRPANVDPSANSLQ